MMRVNNFFFFVILWWTDELERVFVVDVYRFLVKRSQKLYIGKEKLPEKLKEDKFQQDLCV